ncbi:MAG: hypothetical protein DCC59_14875 [Chloroflexi bacterium]|nr:hypothetical protein [Anaerolineales bacterium]MCE7918724.1 isoprenylcysteine carboxylmethyltransferase family protein [Chloroflexi bacterium CFX1]MCQ3952278.1 hypothetical protein [Chloroflexota bacterium]MDL1918296.1 isoprenylcysteine carboxylmethyltransferase family protein [Chloroflexi bacterium CFX5]MCK6566681.1 isoprenylcysteine carboxylmethyltransferase family protein [Anaerolineales bacterium]
MNIFLILFAFALWGLLHSVLASRFVKDKFRGLIGRGGMRLYRLGYNLFSVVSFAPLLYLAATLEDQPLYRIPPPWNFLFFGFQSLSALLLFVAAFQTDLLSLTGLRSLFQEENPDQLVTRGLYAVVRHPLYLFSLTLLWLDPTMTVNSLVFYIGATAYFIVGAYFEERKLLRDFGEAYAEYKRKTPFLIPMMK